MSDFDLISILREECNTLETHIPKNELADYSKYKVKQFEEIDYVDNVQVQNAYNSCINYITIMLDNPSDGRTC